MTRETIDQPFWKNIIVVVTGGGSGICLSFVKTAHSLGAKIIIGDLRLTQEAKEFVSKAGPDRIVFQRCDVTEWDQLQELVSTSEERFGDVPDVWIAGAGIFEPPSSNFWADPEDTRYATVEVNISHPIKLTRIAMRAVLGKNKPGTVLIISSISGLRGNYGAPMYCATKFAVIGFVRSMAEAEKREGLRVMAICPGLTHTHLWSDRPDTMSNFRYEQEHAMSPTDVAERMIEMCQQTSVHRGGVVLETSRYGTRVVPEWNVDPPKHPRLGAGTGNNSEETFSHVADLLKNERGAGFQDQSWWDKFSGSRAKKSML